MSCRGRRFATDRRRSRSATGENAAMRVPREKCVEWHVRLRADITCDHTVGTVDVVVGEVTAEGDGSVLGSAASPLGVRWKFRPFARLPKRVHSVGRNKVEIVDFAFRTVPVV